MRRKKWWIDRRAPGVGGPERFEHVSAHTMEVLSGGVLVFRDQGDDGDIIVLSLAPGTWQTVHFEDEEDMVQ